MKQATLLFLQRDGETLLAMKKRGFGEGHWNGVGGKVEEGESIEDAAIRECFEEINVTPAKLRKLGNLTFRFATKPTIDQQVTVFTTDEWEGEPQESEEMRPEWFKNSGLPFDTMWDDDDLWLPHVLRGKYVIADFIFEGDKVQNYTISIKDI